MLTRDEADAAVTAAATGDRVDGCAYTRHGTRPVPFGQSLDWVRTMIAEAQQIEAVPDDPDGLVVHVTSDGGRLYRFRGTLAPEHGDGG